MSPHAPDAALALALLRLRGVGRAAAGRLLAAFPTAEALRSSPREQVLVRLKRVPRADAIVEEVQAGEAFPDLLHRAAEVLDVLAARQVTVVTARHPHWPSGLDALGWAQRPPALYCYGNAAALTAPAAALLANPDAGPLTESAYGIAEGLPGLLAPGSAVVLGAETGFDVALAKRAVAGGVYPVAIAASGLSRLWKPFRPVATAAVRAGGALVSPFDMEHGPFPHDVRERALVQAAVARAVVAVDPAPEGAEWNALLWAREQGTPTFCIGTGPEDVETVGAEAGARVAAVLGA